MAVKGRTGARRILLQALYQIQVAGHDAEYLKEQFAERPEYAAADSEYFELLLEQIENARAELDVEIAKFGDIPPDQLDPVEHAALWIALAEFRFHPDVPPKAVMNEAIELAKIYGAEGGHKYVNAVLDKVAAGLPQPGSSSKG
jgi:N utilization substance protein B